YRASNKVTKVDAGAREVTTDFGVKVKYDVVNLIPPQRAGSIAVQADLVAADKRWCEVDHVTYESLKHRNVHVVGASTPGLPTSSAMEVSHEPRPRHRPRRARRDPRRANDFHGAAGGGTDRPARLRQGHDVLGLPRHRRQQPLGGGADPGRRVARVLQEGDRGLRGGQ